MKNLQYHDQTTFSDKAAGTHGDCCRACVCSILGIEPDSLPHPIRSDGEWNTEFHKALHKMGYSLRSAVFDPDIADRSDLKDENWGYATIPQIVMAAGPSPRGDWLHAVVYDRISGKILHDPHPSRAGLKEITSLDYLMPYPRPENPND